MEKKSLQTKNKAGKKRCSVSNSFPSSLFGGPLMLPLRGNTFHELERAKISTSKRPVHDVRGPAGVEWEETLAEEVMHKFGKLLPIFLLRVVRVCVCERSLFPAFPSFSFPTGFGTAYADGSII